MKMIGLKRMEPLEDRTVQRLTMIGMRDLDELSRTLAEILAVEVRNPVFGNNVMDMCPRRNHAGTQLEKRDDLAFAA